MFSVNASFPVDDEHEFQIYWSAFGLEVYSVNGEVIDRRRNFSFRTYRTFVVGIREVEIKVDMAPSRKSWFSAGHWIAQAYVDGELVVEDLTPKLRQQAQKIDQILNRIIVAFAILLAIVVLTCLVIFSIDLLLP